MKQKTTFFSVSILIFSLMSSFLTAQEDKIVESIDDARSAYLNQEYREAAALLNRALKQVNAKLVAELKSFLPEPFGGWDADKPEGGASGLALLSKLSAKRHYYKRGTGKSIDVELISNAPKIPNIRMWLSNPRLMNSEEGMAFEEINGTRCITRYEAVNRYAEVNILVGSSMLVIIRGFEAKNLDDVKKFAKKMKINDMEVKFP